ncbi:MAG: hypothetical protein BWK80_19255 [Desulfobacteraceae bacterium IS3]|nr:MAG: hypothetical protein BWK80_19255 [Desulfobacteraceae bacterium IS3]
MSCGIQSVEIVNLYQSFQMQYKGRISDLYDVSLPFHERAGKRSWFRFINHRIRLWVLRLKRIPLIIASENEAIRSP